MTAPATISPEGPGRNQVVVLPADTGLHVQETARSLSGTTPPPAITVKTMKPDYLRLSVANLPDEKLAALGVVRPADTETTAEREEKQREADEALRLQRIRFVHKHDAEFRALHERLQRNPGMSIERAAPRSSIAKHYAIWRRALVLAALSQNPDIGDLTEGVSR